jgi:hypothetical protein
VITGKLCYKHVAKTIVNHSDHLITIEFVDKSGKVVETLQTTRQHPFYVDGKGFVRAGGLAVGNAIVTRAGSPLTIKSIKWQRRPEGYTVYNFEVEDVHNYFVGKANGGALVHNPGECANGGLFDESELGEMANPTKHGDLRARMGEPPFPGAEAHHELPWELKDWFAKRGLNVNDPAYGKWVDPVAHDQWTPAYRNEWIQYINDKPNATKAEVLLKLRWIRLLGKYR